MDEDKKRNAIIAALAVCVVLCLFLVGREVTSGPPGEAKNPNFGHATPAAKSLASKSAGSAEDQSKDTYYNQLKFNRPDLSESELRAKTDHWWKVKNGEATVGG